MTSRLLRTKHEETLNGITHSIPAIVFLSLSSFADNITVALYCLVFFFMFLFSTIYHLTTLYKNAFRIIDQYFIYISIGMTGYLCSVSISFNIVVILVIVTSTSILYHSYRLYQNLPDGLLIPGFYLFNGVFYVCILSLYSQWSLYLLTGLISYTVGFFFYINDHNKYWHAVWHFWVVVGAVFIYQHILSNLP
jgi:hemolysin III